MPRENEAILQDDEAMALQHDQDDLNSSASSLGRETRGEDHEEDEEVEGEEEDAEIELEDDDVLFRYFFLLGSEEEEPARHHGISCDECGVQPIVGTRYHSMRVIDYDICQECYDENHRNLTLANAFVTLCRPADINEADYFENPYAMRIDAWNWEHIRQELQSHASVQNLDWTLNSDEMVNQRLLESITRAIALSTHLKVLYLRIFTDPGPPLTYLLDHGIILSTSIRVMSICYDRLNDEHVQRLVGLIQRTQNIRFLRILVNRRPLRRREGERMNEVILPVFQALSQTNIQSFVYEGGHNLDEGCRQAAIDALRTRPCLKNIQAAFPEDNGELRQLMLNKKGRWMKDWNDPDATSESRLCILQEITSCKQVDPEDVVPALFHFLRSNPGVLPTTL